MGGHLRYDARVSHRVLHLRPGLLQPRDHVRLSVSRYEVIIYRESCFHRIVPRSSFRGNNVENNARAGIGSAILENSLAGKRRISPVFLFFFFLKEIYIYIGRFIRTIDIKLNSTFIFDTFFSRLILWKIE